jgi:hypothetical protein
MTDEQRDQEGPERVADEATPDLEVTAQDTAEQVKGGATRVQGTVKWFNGEKGYGLDIPPTTPSPAAPPTLPAQQ